MPITPYSGNIPNRSTQTQAEFSTNVDDYLSWFASVVPEFNSLAVGSTSTGTFNAIEVSSAGTAAAPVFRFSAALTTGLYSSGGIINMSVAGVQRYTFGDTTFAYSGDTMTIGGGQVYRAGAPLGVVGVIIEDQKASGANGGTFTSGADQVRTLNTFAYNGLGLGALSSNRFTLPAGTYIIEWSAPGHNVGFHQSMLYNQTDAVIVARGTSERCAPAAFVSSPSTGSAVVAIASSKAFEIRHRCTDTFATNGFGAAAGFGTEVYTRVRITKIA